MDLETIVKLIKQRLLEGWVLTCCVKECVERLKRYTDADVVYIFEDVGLALVRKTKELKRFIERLMEVSDEEFEKLRIMILRQPGSTELCYGELGLAGRGDEEEAEWVAGYVLEYVLKEKARRTMSRRLA